MNNSGKDNDELASDGTEKPNPVKVRDWLHDAWKGSFNFYRIHMLVFTIAPLIFGAIIYAGDTNHGFAYIDTLFVATSAFTVTGLSTIELSHFNGFQQAVLFFCMSIGSVSTVSIVMVIIRRFYFRKRFEHVIMTENKRKAQRRPSWYEVATSSARETASGIRSRIRQSSQRPSDHSERPSTPNNISPSSSSSSSEFKTPIKPAGGTKLNRVARSLGIGTSAHHDPDSIPPIGDKQKKKRRFTPSMIRRVDAPALINRMAPGGWISDKASAKSMSPPHSPMQSHQDIKNQYKNADNEHALDTDSESEEEDAEKMAGQQQQQQRKRSSVTLQASGRPSRIGRGESFGSRSIDRPSQDPQPQPIIVDHGNSQVDEEKFPRSATIGFREPDLSINRQRTAGTNLDRSNTYQSGRSRSIAPSGYFPRTTTKPYSTRDRNFGGFPGPLTLITRFVDKIFPQFRSRLDRSVTIPYTHTYTSQPEGTIGGLGSRGKHAPYITFDAIVGRNSVFKDLTDEQLDELGGAEYLALKILTVILIFYYFFFQLIGLTIIAPYINEIPRFRNTVEEEAPNLNPVWYTAFNTVSAYSNTGMSLVDSSLQKFQTAYGMYLPISFLILLGNTCFPIMLRFIIWLGTKVVRKESQEYRGLHFLLDHPRRAFLYLFPSHQTYFLLSMVVIMVVTDWVCFLLLDIGTPSIEEIPLGTRFACGFMQATAVRAAGFNIVNLANLSPSVQLLYLIMMFVSVYPIALSVRGTNVYEEMSLGIFSNDDQSSEEPNEDNVDSTASPSRGKLWGSYFGWHVKKQLSFDIWWLAFVLFLLCIIERGKILDEEKSYFTIFSILFEVVSAYGTCGLSLGVNDKNYSLSGEMRTLSKLLLMVVMIRGRHRGLPNAIDRAVLLPSDLRETDQQMADQQSQAEALRRTRSMATSFSAARNNTFYRELENNYRGPPFPMPQSNEEDDKLATINEQTQQPTPSLSPESTNVGLPADLSPKHENKPDIPALSEEPEDRSHSPSQSQANKDY
ncbi:TrkH-domain-containing protein [Wallemia mellicola]|nr:TrkH-domain-containing protein [Wallemia mellicola]